MSAMPSPKGPLGPRPHPEVEVDDRWVSEFRDVLGCLSLSTDDRVREHRFDELGCMGDPAQDATKPDQEPRHRHEEVGI